MSKAWEGEGSGERDGKMAKSWRRQEGKRVKSMIRPSISQDYCLFKIKNVLAKKKIEN